MPTTCSNPGGRLVITYRDLSVPLEGLERFIAVRADSRAVLTCFLEYETETVKVHDLLHVRRGGDWKFIKSDYRKLRLPVTRVAEALVRAGFQQMEQDVENGFVTLVASR